MPSASPTWLARSLVIDVYPASWVANKQETPWTEYRPPEKIYYYPDRAMFYLGFLPTEDVAGWFARPEHCELIASIRNARQPDLVTFVFRQPELQDVAFGHRVFSRQTEGFSRLPWPRVVYDYNLKDPNVYQNGDQQVLYVPGLPHFDNFREARGHLIHELPDLRNYQDRDIVIMRAVDGEGWIHEAHLIGRELTIAVRGTKLHPAQIILKGTGLFDEPNNPIEFLGQRSIVHTFNSDPPSDLRVILANEESGELDQVWRNPYGGPLDNSSPHFVIEGSAQNQAYARPTIGVPTYPAAIWDTGVQPQANKPVRHTPTQASAKRELRVIVASPSDVARERNSVQRVLDDLNEGVADQLGLRLTKWSWDTDAVPGFHPKGPQGQIDDQMRIEDANIVVGIFSARIGSQIIAGRSGTQHELLKAADAWEKTGRPHILVYFNERPPRTKSKNDADQQSALYAFRAELEPRGLIGTYPGSSRFADVLRTTLQRLLRDNYRR